MELCIHTYKGFKIMTKIGPPPDYADPEARVFDPRFPRDPALFVTTNFAAALKWIDAYVVGEQWAVQAKSSAR